MLHELARNTTAAQHYSNICMFVFDRSPWPSHFQKESARPSLFQFSVQSNAFFTVSTLVQLGYVVLYVYTYTYV